MEGNPQGHAGGSQARPLGKPARGPAADQGGPPHKLRLRKTGRPLAHLVGDNGSNQISLPRGGAGFVPGIPALGIPNLYLADGSVGVGNAVGQATALPSSIASAASWDVNEAYKYGTVIGAKTAQPWHE